MKQFITFRLNKQLFGINIYLVREINQNLEITPVPKTHNYVRGLINLRGQIVTILDLRVRLGRPAGDIQENNHNIILKTNHEIAKLRGLDIDDEYCGRDDGIGLLVDELGDVVEIDESSIDPRPANVDEMEGRFFSGVIQLKNDLLVLLRMPEILKEETSTYK